MASTLAYFCIMHVAIILGGISPEHEISIKSAKNIYKAGLKSNKHTFSLVGISKTGQWFLLPDSFISSSDAIGAHNSHQPLILMPGVSNPVYLAQDLNNPLKIDAVFPITHGNNGEDGLLQGLLESLQIPYAGPGVLASAMCMDKDITKQVLAANGIRVTPGTCIHSWKQNDYEGIAQEFGFPLFIKPANAGSAVGVGKANNISEFKEKADDAFKFDDKVLVEKAINGREVETAVLGNRVLEVSTVGEIVVDSGFYTYENKYSNPETVVNVPALNFDLEQAATLSQIALKAYETMQLEGFSRIDFFYVNENEFYLNEINTLPGFTDISMYPKLMETCGLGYTELIEKICELAVERHTYRNNKKRSLN